MVVLVLVNFKRGTEHITGTAGRLTFCEAPDSLDKHAPSQEDLEILSTFAWVREERLWDCIEDITWQDASGVVHKLENRMVRRMKEALNA